jgi:hypothetical protein
MDSEREKGKYKIKYTMHRIFGKDYQYGEKYRQKRDEVKCIHGLIITKHFPPLKKAWAKV